MAKNNDKLDMPEIEVEPNKTPENKKVKPKNTKSKANSSKKKFSLKKVFREMISELKKVEWAPFKRTKNNNGVINQTGSVIIVVLFFLIFITLFDTGLTKLLELLLEAANV